MKRIVYVPIHYFLCVIEFTKLIEKKCIFALRIREGKCGSINRLRGNSIVEKIKNILQNAFKDH